MKPNAPPNITRSVQAHDLKRDTAIEDAKSVSSSPLIDTAAAAMYLGASKQTLTAWRSTKRYALPYVKIGRLVQYRVADLDAFIQARTILLE